MQTKELPNEFQHMSPAGAEVRVLMNNTIAGSAHCTLKKGKISKPVSHRTVSEFWYVISGHGQIWRKQGSKEIITDLSPGVSIDIPLGTDFQYRCHEDADLVFICFTMPPWPGHDEIKYLTQGAWLPTHSN